MKPEQPGQFKKQEQNQGGFDAADYLKRKLGIDQPEQGPEEIKPTMSDGKMDEVVELLKNLSMEDFLDMRMVKYGYGRERFEEERGKIQALIKEFASEKANLDSGKFDSHGKEKKYRGIFEGKWLEKLDEAFDFVSKEIGGLEVFRKSRQLVIKSRQMEKGNPVVLTEAEESNLRSPDFTGDMDKQTTIKEQVRRISAGLKALRDYGFDEKRLGELEEYFKEVKK